MSPRLSRDEQNDRNRALLFAAARRVFLARGYHAATLEQIADEAGFSKGVVYSRFASKADMFLALLEDRIAERAGAERAGGPRRWPARETSSAVRPGPAGGAGRARLAAPGDRVPDPRRPGSRTQPPLRGPARPDDRGHRQGADRDQRGGRREPAVPSAPAGRAPAGRRGRPRAGAAGRPRCPRRPGPARDPLADHLARVGTGTRPGRKHDRHHDHRTRPAPGAHVRGHRHPDARAHPAPGLEPGAAGGLPARPAAGPAGPRDRTLALPRRPPARRRPGPVRAGRPAPAAGHDQDAR